MSNGELPRFLQLSSALQQFVTVEGTQSQLHIRPLHQYLTGRLVLEGGFDPEEITPHPPLRVESKDARKLLNFAPEVDPGLVYGFLHFLKANRQGEAQLAPNDIALTAAGEPVAAIRRYHDVLLGLAGRRLVRNDYTRYEAVGLAMVVPHGETRNQLLAAFPPSDSPLHFAKFFEAAQSSAGKRFVEAWDRARIIVARAAVAAAFRQHRRFRTGTASDVTEI